MDFSETFLNCLLYPFLSLFIIFLAVFLLKEIADGLGYHNLYNNLGKLICTTRQKTKKHILIAYILGSFLFLFEGDFSFWGWVLGYLAALIPASWLAYRFLKRSAIICPLCGEWNASERVKFLDTYEYDKQVKVDRDIYNNKKEKIGSYETRENHTFRATKRLMKCKACGHEFKDYYVVDTSE